MKTILSGIHTPQDIKTLDGAQLNQLAGEIRQLLVEAVADSGGHLAANLGVVELTLALHYVLETPRDKIIWDVGHQCYTHKIITGRQQGMFSLRQMGGISGFPKHEESPHDAFDTGHSSTSISAALGMAIARDLQGEKYSVAAVIGDGALTGGMAFEALNHAGHEARDLLVVLNDNEMSISKNVGAMSGYLSRLRSDPSYYRTKEEIEIVLKRIPGIGPNLIKAAHRFKDKLKYLMVPGILFEELGFTYIGPVNGHLTADLIQVLKNAIKMKGPVLLHTITEKGRGYEPARKNPDIFHGVGPFDARTGTFAGKSMKPYTEVFGDYIVAKAREDEKVVAITAAMPAGTGLTEFSRLFPRRFFDVGICEQHAVTLAAGMARQGLKPVVCIYSSFLQRAYDQVIHDVALQRLPVVFAVDRAGLVGEDGPTHHGVFDLSFLRPVPNLTIMAPAHEQELVDMMETALSLEGPSVIRYPRGAGEGIAPSLAKRKILEIGRAEPIQKGRDIALLSIGRFLPSARAVAALLEEQGLSAELVNARFLKPLDRETICDLARRFGRLVTLEDNAIIGGFGSAVLEVIQDNQIQAEVLRVAIGDEFVPQGKVERLFDHLLMDPPSIMEAIMKRWPDLHKTGTGELLQFGQI